MDEARSTPGPGRPEPSASERQFADKALLAGFLTEEQVRRLLDLQAELRTKGKIVSLAGLGLRERLMSPEMTATVLLMIERPDGVEGPTRAPAVPTSVTSLAPAGGSPKAVPPAPEAPVMTEGARLASEPARSAAADDDQNAGSEPSSMRAAQGRRPPSTISPHVPKDGGPQADDDPEVEDSGDELREDDPTPILLVHPMGDDSRRRGESPAVQETAAVGAERESPDMPQPALPAASGRSHFDNLPVVMFEKQYATRTHVRFLCFYCAGELALPWDETGSIVECSRCRREMRLVSKAQVELEKQREKDRKQQEAAARQDLLRRVAELRRTGIQPPDQIAILGRPSSGKSVYLAVLYQQLWTSRDDLTGRALDGRNHAAILRDFQSLRQGQWLARTAAVRKCDLLVEFRGIPVTLSTMDYPGEVFQQVFFENRLDTPEQQALFSQIESCMGAMMLVDPQHAVGGEVESLDLEFSFVQVAEHLIERGFGNHMLLVLTKKDRNQELVESCGGPRGFVERYLPRLLRKQPNLMVVHMYSVPTKRGADGRAYPHIGSHDLDHVRLPLRRLLTQIDPAYLQVLAELDRNTTLQAEAQIPPTTPAGPDPPAGTAAPN